MMIRLIGAIILLTGCSGFAFVIGFRYRRDIKILHSLLSALQEMEWELKYRLTPLPDLLSIVARTSEGTVRNLFQKLEFSLKTESCVEISGYLNSLLQTMDLPNRSKICLKALGISLGRYDLEGQLEGLQSVRNMCLGYLDELERHRTERLRNYQTLGFCTGAALVILLV